MKYKEFSESNKPFLFVSSMPFLQQFNRSKKYCACLILAAIIVVAAHGLYCFFQDSKSVNKILISRESTINAELTKIENINDILEAEILILMNEVRNLSEQKDNKKIAKISKYLADSDIKGSGLRIVLNDSSSLFSIAQYEQGIVHNTDLLKFVNFLWEKGATAISINDERIGPNTYISCVGPTILINKKRINSPFVIQTIGEKFNEKEMKNDAFVLSLKLRGISVEISKSDNIVIPSGKYATFME